MTGSLPNKELFTPSEVAKYYAVHIKTVYRWVREGKINSASPSSGTLRIKKEDILKVGKPTI